jgi:uncharacterized protein (TIGR01777 family)
MILRQRRVVPAPLEDVFAWRGRPGAFARLLPPWVPVRLVTEDASLRDGRTVLSVPGGITWTMQRRPDLYQPPHRFAEELRSPFPPALRWQHTVELERAGESSTATEMVDTVETTLPPSWPRRTLAYQCHQLQGDLAAQTWARTLHPEPLRVAVTGSTGLVGTALTAFLTAAGHQVVRLVRRPPAGANERHWQPDDPDPALVDGIDALVHLAGASLAGRFTADHKGRIRASRVGPTHALATAAARSAARGSGPACLVAASAIGFYGADRGDEVLTEASPGGDGFLAEVVADWEDAARPASEAGVRVVHVRTGIVQSPRGGTLRLLLPLFASGLGGRLGSGQQWMSWIGIDDLLDVYCRALVDPLLSGAVNAVAPEPVRNADYSATLARVLRRPAIVPVPAFGPRLLLGQEGARELAEASQRVQPERLLAAGHLFRHADLEPALRHGLGR